MGYDDLPVEMLVELGIHHVTPRFIQETRTAFGDDFPLEQIIEMRINGDSVKEYLAFKAAGIQVDED